MIFLSQLLKKPIYLGDEKYGKIVDFGMPSSLQTPFAGTVLVQKGRKKFAIPLTETSFHGEQLFLNNKDYEEIPYNPEDFYLAEDLLDKQVIDISGKRLVRVNDVLLKRGEGSLRVIGIDVSFAGVLRRLGLGGANPLRTVTIPWAAVEAFDYETGDVRIKLGKNSLNTLHPAELADILEEVGTKEREGIVEVLNPELVADAIEEANEETQEAIFEELPANQLKKILEKMPLSEIADVIDDVNPETFKRIIKLLGTERAKRVQKLMLFPDDVAGGLMQESFYKENGERTIGETLGSLSKYQLQPETIIVVDEHGKLVGQVHANELLNADPGKTLKSLVVMPYFVAPDTEFPDIFRMFSRYNLRLLPVKDENDEVVGVISIDSVLQRIEEEEERDETI